MEKNKDELWWRNSPGKQNDLRELLWEITSKLGLKKPTGNISWFPKGSMESKERKFSNVFREDKSPDSIYSLTIMQSIVSLVKNYKIKFSKSNIEDEIRSIIVKSKFNISDPKSFKMFNCKEIKNCVYDENYRNCERKGCFQYWLITTLEHIESNYWSILNNSEYIASSYDKQNNKEIIEKIYSDITNYENDFYKCKDYLTDTVALFNSCIRCWNIQDVMDEKLAYVKWFTARLSTWPFFRACLYEVNHYDEKVVFQLLNSASKILSSIDKRDDKEVDELWSKVEIDRITSYISLAYVAPFHLTNIISYKNLSGLIETKLHSIDSNLSAKLSIRLWCLNYLTEVENSQKHNQILKKIEQSKKKYILSSVEYSLYRYMFDPKFLNQVKDKFILLNSYTDILQNNFDEVYALSSLFYNRYNNNYYINDFEEFYVMESLCGDVFDFKYRCCSPAVYTRPLSDFMLLKNFVALKNHLIK